MKNEPKQVSPGVRNILVALDGGGLSDHAIDRALELAKAFDARLEIVHALGLAGVPWELVPSPLAVSAHSDPLSRVREQVVTHVSDLLEHAGRARTKADELVNVITGQPAGVLLERAQSLGADLIILGALRKRRTFDFGSTARAILAKAPCAVWIQPGPPVPIRRVLVAFDFSAESALALSTAIDLARRVGASVRVLHVFDLRPYIMDDGFWIANFESIDDARKSTSVEFEKLMASTDWNGIEHDWIFAEGTPDAQILESAKSADLLLMGTHGRSGFASAVLGSVAYTVLKNSVGPVMVVRKPQRQFAHA